MKICAKCKKELEEICFCKSNLYKDGLKTWCRECCKEDNRNRAIKNGIKVREKKPKVKNGYKYCIKCQLILKEEMFSYSSKSKDGKNQYCKKCVKVLNQAYSIKKGCKLKISPSYCGEDGKECLKCLKIFPLDNFPKNSRGRLGRGSYCNGCQYRYIMQNRFKESRKLYTRQWRRKNRSWWLSRNRIYQANRNYLIKISVDQSITKEFINSIYDEEVCYYCERKILEKDRTLDHKTPLCRGGKHTSSNIVMACFNCNSSKSWRTEKEFEDYKCKNNM